MEMTDEQIADLARALPGDFSIYEVADNRLAVLRYSEGIPALSGMDAAEYDSIIADDASAIVVESDRALVASKLTEVLTSGTDADLSYRIVNTVQESVWVHARARFVGVRNGHPVLLVIFSDTSYETNFHEELLDRIDESVHVCDARTNELLYLNRTARRIWNREGSYLGMTCHDFLHDRSKPCPWCGLSGIDTLEIHIDEMYDEDTGKYFKYDRQKIVWHGRDAFAIFAEDITEERNARTDLLGEKGRLENIIEHIPAGVCVFQVKEGAASLVAANARLRQLLDVTGADLGNIGGGDIIERVYPDDRDEAIRASRDMVKGRPGISCEFRIGSAEADTWRWLHLDGVAMPQEDGILLTFGSVTDVTARKIDEERYQKAIDDLLAANPQALCAFELNLTRDTCDEGRGTSIYVQSALAADTAEGIFSNLAKLIVDEDDLALCRVIFNRKSLMTAFLEGKDHTEIEYRRKSDDTSIIWARTYITMVRNPTTEDIEAVVYSEDIDKRKRRDLAHRIVTANGYDYIAIIDVDEYAIRFLEVGVQVDARFRDAYHNDATVRDYGRATTYTMDAWVHPDDQQLYKEASALGTITRALDAEGHYEFAVRGIREGAVRRKRIQYAYLDAGRRSIVVWQTDVTEAFQREQEDAGRLEVALAAAQQASNAKSVFLSRMSHEIRTPMNAIIGMDTLAAQAIGNDERVADCIAKIGISSRYLLSLINDILDMSRIESGKMMLSSESFLLRDLVASVNDLIYSQAQNKGLDYECNVGPETVEAYVGDFMKLQQVLVNLLGNAVKFTDRGKVMFSVHQIFRSKDQAKVRFIVNDTGRGISEEDQARIFEPFEQADTSTTTAFGGTGLGLAITKSLVELMGGTIRLRSIEGVGSEFTIEVPLAVDESIVGAPEPIYHFELMRTLVVDDDLVTCEQTDQILKDIGMQGEWVTSGAEAVERVHVITEDGGHYDFILIDWKMPDMDGIETTSRIRKIVGPDVTIIIVSAYDWQSIETEARAAGANLLISKPLLKSTLISAFKKAQDQVEENVLAVEEFDFSGKRVLVAEDNGINAEIAKELLILKGFEVEVATDGLKALEMFTQNPVGYYDAILMDVRMPQMDGLQAAANIRRWSKEDAKTVPIIAMTANAFDEDVEKSRAAGMNAHLAKPIEPDLMFRTLSRFIDA